MVEPIVQATFGATSGPRNLVFMDNDAMSPALRAAGVEAFKLVEARAVRIDRVDTVATLLRGCNRMS
jgi:hypothetical protein